MKPGDVTTSSFPNYRKNTKKGFFFFNLRNVRCIVIASFEFTKKVRINRRKAGSTRRSKGTEKFNQKGIY